MINASESALLRIKIAFGYKRRTIHHAAVGTFSGAGQWPTEIKATSDDLAMGTITKEGST
ncbi:MAG: hypothetical protein O9256_00730 [Rhizobiaceae bacterium]|nr:hypothetical protein [Rhizobiaceae bacterium]